MARRSFRQIAASRRNLIKARRRRRGPSIVTRVKWNVVGHAAAKNNLMRARVGKVFGKKTRSR